DRALLLAARGIRAFGFGFSAVLLGVHLERDGLAPAEIGITLGVGLLAASLTGLGSAALAAKIGRRRTLAVVGVLMAVTGLDLALAPPLALLLSGKVEGEPAPRVFGSFRPLAGLAALFALDSLGGGFVANAVIAYWLHARFGAGPNLLGPIFAGVAILQSLSYEVSGRLG